MNLRNSLAALAIAAAATTTAVLLPGETEAQTRTVIYSTDNVRASEMRVTFLDDGGCTAIATATSTANDSKEVRQVERNLGSARCNALAVDADKLARLAFRVGDGGAP